MAPSTSKHSSRSTSLHLLVWAVILAIPLLLTMGQQEHSLFFPLRFWIPVLCCSLIFYTNYLFLIDRFLFTDNKLAFVVLNLVIAGICLLVSEWMMEFIKQVDPQVPYGNISPKNRPTAIGGGKNIFKIRTFLLFLLTTGTSVAIRAVKKWQIAEEHRKQLENENLKTELSFLRYQLQPHFFFNSLNNIYSLTDSNPVMAKESILMLSKLMRHVLYDTKEERIMLKQEVSFLENFIKLMLLRLTDHVKVKYSFPDRLQDEKVAPLLFIPLLENVFKHGVSGSKPSTILIKMYVEKGILYFHTENTVLPKLTTTEHYVKGIGLSNLKKRLDLIYPNRYSLDAGIQDGVYVSHLRLQL